MSRTLVASVSAVVAVIALAAQLFSSALFGSTATAHSLPHAISGEWPFTLASATGLDRIPGVRLQLARAAVLRGDAATAETLVAALPASREVTDVQGRIALVRNDPSGALNAFAQAGDFAAAATAIDALGTRDPLLDLQTVMKFGRVVDADRSHPEIAAEIDFREGQLASIVALSAPERFTPYGRQALAAYASALARAPREEKYLLNYAFQALRMGDAVTSRATYRTATDVVPDSVDGFLGLAVASSVLGDCAAARPANDQARILATEQHRTIDPAGDGYASAAVAAYARCTT